jgi:hypothetical protein
MVPTLLSIAITLVLIGLGVAAFMRSETVCDAPDEPWLDWDGEVPAELLRPGGDELTLSDRTRWVVRLPMEQRELTPPEPKPIRPNPNESADS